MDTIDKLLSNPATQRVASLLVRRIILAAGPAATLYAQTATGQTDQAATYAEVAGWVLTVLQAAYDAWRAAKLASQEAGK